MAIKTIKVCDLCGAEQEHCSYWGDEFTDMQLSTPCGAGCNLIKFKGLICQECGKAFYTLWKRFQSERGDLKEKHEQVNTI
jgi:hypothetical protein